MEESGDEPDFLALAVSEDDRGLQDAPDVMGDDSELEGEPDFLLALAPGILENAPLPAGISLPLPPSWRRMGSFHFLLAFRFHQHSASPAPELALDGRRPLPAGMNGEHRNLFHASHNRTALPASPFRFLLNSIRRFQRRHHRHPPLSQPSASCPFPSLSLAWA